MALIIIRDAMNLIPDIEAAWDAYMCVNELLLATLCLLLPWRWLSWGMCAVFISQAIDEALSGNIFGDGIWEYPVAAITLLASWMILGKK